MDTPSTQSPSSAASDRGGQRFAVVKQTAVELWSTYHNRMLRDKVRNFLIDGTTGTLLFFSTVSAVQLLQGTIKVSAASPIVPQVLGFVAVASGSILSGHLSKVPRRAFLSEAREGAKANAPTLRNFLVSSAKVLLYSTLGVAVFRMMGGRFLAIAPSDYRFLGAFHRNKASLPATLEYADTGERGAITALGRLIGCHTCGKTKGQYHADHMPPVSFVKKANERWWRRLLGLKLTQRFYPQCSSCSNVQGQVVKKNVKQLKYHFTSLRAYHFTGFWVFMMSAAIGKKHSGRDEEDRTSMKQVKRGGDVRDRSSGSGAVDQQSGLERALKVGMGIASDISGTRESRLASLREIERKLRKDLGGASESDRVEIERQLKWIEDEKKHIKLTSKSAQ